MQRVETREATEWLILGGTAVYTGLLLEAATNEIEGLWSLDGVCNGVGTRKWLHMGAWPRK